ncbi:hypothetical protein AB0J43_26720 [Nonomuraea fuscirosea]
MAPLEFGELSQLVGNLLGNLRMHTPPGVSCHLDLAVEGGAASDLSKAGHS